MAGARGTWNSRFGFIMAAVGSAVGLGNLVRFPRELAGNGGAIFLIVYLGLLLLVGLPAILGEMSLGKITQLSPVNAFKKMAGEHGRKWAIVGIFGMMAAILVLFFYTVMTGWTLRFFFAGFTDAWWDDPSGFFHTVAYGPWTIFWNAIVVAITVYIVSRGVSGGIEKVTVIIIPALFAIIGAIAIYALVQSALDGNWEGYRQLFSPDISELTPQTVSNAVGQVFFSLSLGQGAMLTYASYMDRKQSVTEDGTTIAMADTGVAVLAGLMVFPVLAFTGLLASPDPAIQNAISGTFGTAFVALPNAFVEMGAVTGRIVGTVFFMGLFFAALSSAISLLEVPVSVLVDNMGLTRARAAILMGLVVYTFGVVSSLNETWFTLYDEIAVNVFIVIGVALTTFFVGWIVKDAGKELDANTKFDVSKIYIPVMKYVTPTLILAAFIFGGLWGTDVDGGLAFWADGGDGGTAAKWNNLWHELKHGFGAE